MKKLTGYLVSGTIVLVSVILPFLLVPGTPSVPFAGLAFFFVSCATLFFFVKEKKSYFDFVIYCSLLFFSLCLVFRVQSFLTFLNVVTLFFLASLFIISEKRIDTIRTVLFSPFMSFYSLMATRSQFPYTYVTRKLPGIKNIPLGSYFPQIILTFVLLLIVIPLLSYANPVFSDVVQSITRFFDLSDFITRFFDNFPLFIIRLILFGIFLFFLPHLATLGKDSTQTKVFHFKPMQFSLLIPKVVLGIVLLVFFVTQIQFYFASPTYLQSLGYTNSQHAREVFAQLGVVAFIIFLLVYGDSARSKWNNWLTTLLVIQGIFLTGIALKSVYDYTTLWGFTHKRLYGFAGVSWVVGSFILFAYYFYKKLLVQKLLKSLIIFTISVIAVINIVNFDYLIYHYAKPTVFGIDHEYLVRLSPDGGHYKEHISLLTENVKKNPTYQSVFLLGRELRSIEYLQKKYKSITFGSFNYSEYKQYLNTKDINVENLYFLMNQTTDKIQEEEMRMNNQNVYSTPTPPPFGNIQQ